MIDVRTGRIVELGDGALANPIRKVAQVLG